ncbi:hypothetical protein [Thalassococcus sp. S3]|uniref:hypothetical protein n=1 Tax=Thalassococcus sp. S3 TaxID=2017482 RepID=UPI0010240B97|nr:hypothetical protein [Thalassococcus sp. S3]QBF31545.1 hypothetical protein CFI11_09995 [Thalassococcus sp. S3]
MKGDPQTDPKGLIFEAFRIDRITLEECRSIFLDWALSLPVETDTGPALRILLERYQSDAPDHPMLTVMREGLVSMEAPRRRGGWRSRPRN